MGHAPVEAPEPEGLAAARRDRVVALLLREAVVTDRQVREAFNQWRRKGEQDTLWRWLARHPEVDTDAVFAHAAQLYAFRRADLGKGRPDPAFVKAFVEELPGAQQDQMLAFGVLPVEYEHDTERRVRRIVLAAQDPGSPDILSLVHAIGLEPFDLRYAPETEIRPLLTELFPRRNEFLERAQSEQWAYDLGADFAAGEKSIVDDDAIEAEINRSGLINLFEACLVEGVRKGVSDIHIWPNADRQTEFHFRIDGELQHWHTEGKVHPEALLAVVKDKAGNVDRFEREMAQDGFIQRTVDGALIRYRVSVLPIATADRGVRAESIVIRILDDRKVLTDMGKVGLLPDALAAFQKAIRQPHGMVILTGPTGSGKSTTLVAALAQVVRPQVNALTIEDPVEYIIKGVRQIKLGPAPGHGAGPPVRPPPRPRHRHGRRDARPRDGGAGREAGQHGPPHVLDAPHERRALGGLAALQDGARAVPHRLRHQPRRRPTAPPHALPRLQAPRRRPGHSSSSTSSGSRPRRSRRPRSTRPARPPRARRARASATRAAAPSPRPSTSRAPSATSSSPPRATWTRTPSATRPSRRGCSRSSPRPARSSSSARRPSTRSSASPPPTTSPPMDVSSPFRRLSPPSPSSPRRRGSMRRRLFAQPSHGSRIGVRDDGEEGRALLLAGAASPTTRPVMPQMIYSIAAILLLGISFLNVNQKVHGTQERMMFSELTLEMTSVGDGDAR